jgi:hypothetical protein
MNFSGTITSDFMKLAQIPESKRQSFINFAATDFATLRQSLVDYAKTVYPEDYKYFVESDLGMMFLELTAYMGAVMSMKADMLANENFLATAKQRASVKKLMELVGVRMKGPLSAACDAKLTLDNTLGGPFRMNPSNRVITISSPEDGGSVTYTMYKVVNGEVDLMNPNGRLSLGPSEADDVDKKVYTNLVLQEGALATVSEFM